MLLFVKTPDLGSEIRLNKLTETFANQIKLFQNFLLNLHVQILYAMF